jgi:hypothetical protein
MDTNYGVYQSNEANGSVLIASHIRLSVLFYTSPAGRKALWLQHYDIYSPGENAQQRFY